jgi:hypothetical protein
VSDLLDDLVSNHIDSRNTETKQEPEQAAPEQDDDKIIDDLIDARSKAKDMQFNASVMAGVEKQPAQVSEAMKISKEFNVPVRFAENHIKEFRAEKKKRDLHSLRSTNPNLVKWSNTPEKVGLIHDDIEKVSAVDLISSKFKEPEKKKLGMKEIGQGFSTGARQLAKNSLYAALQAGVGDKDEIFEIIAEANRNIETSIEQEPESFKVFKKKMGKELEDLDKNFAFVRDTVSKMFEGEILMGLAKLDYAKEMAAFDFLDIVGMAAKNPREYAYAASQTAINSFAPMLVGGAVGAAGGSIAGPPGALAGFTLGSMATGIGLESTAEFEAALVEKGVDVKDAESLRKAYKNQALIEDAKWQALRKAFTTSAFETLSSLMGGKLLAAPAKGVVKTAKGASKLAKGASKVVDKTTKVAQAQAVEMAGEGGGEYFGSAAAKKDFAKASVGEAFYEALLAPATGGTTGSFVYALNQSRAAVENYVEAREFQSTVEELQTSAQEMQLTTNHPEVVADLINNSSNGAPVYLQADEFEDHWNRKGENPNQKADELLPGGRSQLEQAKEDGNPLEIPMGDFVTKFAEEESFKELSGLVRKDPAMMNGTEAKSFGANIKNLLQDISKEARKEIRKNQLNEDTRKAVENNFIGQFEAAGQGRKEAEVNANFFTTLLTVLGDRRYDKDALHVLRKKNVEITGDVDINQFREGYYQRDERTGFVIKEGAGEVIHPKLKDVTGTKISTIVTNPNADRFFGLENQENFKIEAKKVFQNQSRQNRYTGEFIKITPAAISKGVENLANFMPESEDTQVNKRKRSKQRTFFRETVSALGNLGELLNQAVPTFTTKEGATVFYAAAQSDRNYIGFRFDVKDGELLDIRTEVIDSKSGVESRASSVAALTDQVQLEQADDSSVALLSEIINAGRNRTQTYFQKSKQNQEVVNRINQSSIGFYSRLENEIQNMKDFKKMPASNLLSRVKKISGIKPEEIEETGLDLYLTGYGDEKVTKDQILDYLKNNGVKVRQVLLSSVEGSGGVVAKVEWEDFKDISAKDVLNSEAYEDAIRTEAEELVEDEDGRFFTDDIPRIEADAFEEYLELNPDITEDLHDEVRLSDEFRSFSSDKVYREAREQAKENVDSEDWAWAIEAAQEKTTGYWIARFPNINENQFYFVENYRELGEPNSLGSPINAPSPREAKVRALRRASELGLIDLNVNRSITRNDVPLDVKFDIPSNDLKESKVNEILQNEREELELMAQDRHDSYYSDDDIEESEKLEALENDVKIMAEEVFDRRYRAGEYGPVQIFMESTDPVPFDVVGSYDEGFGLFIGEKGEKVEEVRIEASDVEELKDKVFTELENKRLIYTEGAVDETPQGDPRWSEETKEGGDNYREILLTLPESKDTFQYDVHFEGFDNFVVHIRMKDRVDNEGKKVLFIEELQSDWHQQGREKGYKPKAEEAEKIKKKIDELIQKREDKLNEPKNKKFFKESDAAREDALKKENDADDKLNDLQKEIRELDKEFDSEEEANEARIKRNKLRQEFSKIEKEEVRAATLRRELDKARENFIQEQVGHIEKEIDDLNESVYAGVPDAPFKKTAAWTMLAIKRVIRIAADQGYEKVSWTNGQVHVDRWGTELISWKKQPSYPDAKAEERPSTLPGAPEGEVEYVVTAEGLLDKAGTIFTDRKDAEERAKQLREPRWKVAFKQQSGGEVRGHDLEELARSSADFAESRGTEITSKDQVKDVVKAVMDRQDRYRSIESHTEKIWAKMQSGEDGFVKPREEGMLAFYDNVLKKAVQKYIEKIDKSVKVKREPVKFEEYYEPKLIFSEEDQAQIDEMVEESRAVKDEENKINRRFREILRNEKAKQKAKPTNELDIVEKKIDKREKEIKISRVEIRERTREETDDLKSLIRKTEREIKQLENDFADRQNTLTEEINKLERGTPERKAKREELNEALRVSDVLIKGKEELIEKSEFRLQEIEDQLPRIEDDKELIKLEAEERRLKQELREIDDKVDREFTSKEIKELEKRSKGLGEKRKELRNKILSFKPIETKEFAEEKHWSFDITDEIVKSVIKGQPLFQQDEKIRGFTDVSDPNNIIIGLLADADKSTTPHEIAHAYLEFLKMAMSDLASEGINTPKQQQFHQDMRDLLGYLGVNSFDEVGVEQHELFARTIEAYLMEGKAPTKRLQSMFNTFKTWLVNIYKDLFGLEQAGQIKLNLTPELREILNRMMATDDEIAESENEMSYTDEYIVGLFEKLGIKNDGDNEDLNKLLKAHQDARAEAALKLYGQHLKQLRLKATKEYRERNAINKNKIVDQDVLGYESIKFNSFILKEILTPEEFQALPKSLYSQKGIEPDATAELLGWQSGKDLLQAILTNPSKTAFVEQQTKLTLDREFPNFMNPEQENDLKKEAMDAVTNEKRSRALRMELDIMMKNAPQEVKKLIKKTIPRLPSTDEVKAEAKNRLDELTVREAKENRFRRLENRHRNEAGKSLLKGDFASSIQSKVRESVNHEMGKEASKFEDKLEKGVKKLRKRFNRTDKDLAKSGQIDMIKAGQAILSRFGLLTDAKVERLESYLKQLQAYDPLAYNKVKGLSDSLIQIEDKDYRDLTVAEFNEVLDVANALYDLAVNEKSITVEGKKVDREKIVDDLVAALEKKDKRAILKEDTPFKKFKGFASSLQANMTRVEHLFDNLDDGDFLGPFRTYIWNRANDSQINFQDMSEEYLQKINEIIQEHFKGVLTDRAEVDITKYFDVPNEQGRLKKHEILMALLHSGNESNKRKLLLGRGWGQTDLDGNLVSAQYDRFIEDMFSKGIITKENMDGIQKIWDLFEELKPQAQKVHKNVFGYFFKEIQAQEIVTPFGTYRGGYAPAVTDPLLVESEASRQNEMSTEQQVMQFEIAHTPKNFSIERIEAYNKALSLDFRLVKSHVDKVVRFVTLEEAVTDLNKILNDSRFRDALFQVNSNYGNEVLMPWLSRLATQQTERPAETKAGRRAAEFARFLRKNANMNLMFANVVNTTENLSDFAPLFLEIKPASLKKSLATYTKNPKELANQVKDLSPFMRQRMENQIFEINDSYKALAVREDTKWGKIQNLQDQVGKHAYILQQALQNVMEISAWSAAFDEGVVKFKDEKRAAKYADSVISKVMGSNRAIDIANIEAGNAYQKVVLTFYSYFLNKGNLVFYSSNESKPKAYALGMAAPAILGAVLRRAVKGFDEDDDEDYADDAFDVLIMSQFRFATATIPFGGSAFRLIEGQFTDKTYDDRLSISPLVSMLEGVSGPVNLLTREELRSKDIRDSASFFGTFTGFPLLPAARPMGFVIDLEKGKQKAENPIDYSRGFITGRSGKR